MNVFVYLCVFALVGWNLVIAKDGNINQVRRKNESTEGWANLFGQIRVGGKANETIPEFPYNMTLYARGGNINITANFGNASQQAGNGINISGGASRYEIHLSNKTGIPMDLFFQWWSVVRPFGNKAVTRPKYPWMVAVQSKRGRPNSHLCSGNILTKLHVLTTCLCLSNPTGSTVMPLIPKDPNSINIIAGVSMLNIPLKEQLFHGQIRNAVDINIHPHCSLAPRFDYGVIELEYYLYYTDRVLPIPDPFVTFHGKISSKGDDRFFAVMKQSQICYAAGWPSKQTFWDGESEGEQKTNGFMILGKDSCFARTPQFGNQLVCTEVVSGEPKKSLYGQVGDVGSGLVCHSRVTAILSHHIGGHVVFASIRPALSFLWQYYQDQNEIYTISSSLLPAVSSIQLIFATHVTVISTYL